MITPQDFIFIAALTLKELRTCGGIVKDFSFLLNISLTHLRESLHIDLQPDECSICLQFKIFNCFFHR